MRLFNRDPRLIQQRLTPLQLYNYTQLVSTTDPLPFLYAMQKSPWFPTPIHVQPSMT